MTRGLLEDELHIGDQLRIGTVLTQVVAPRRPCWKLGARWLDKELPLAVQENGMTGFYLRVTEPGQVRLGDRIAIIKSAGSAVTVAELDRVMNVDRGDLAAARNVLDSTSLPAPWRRTLERRLGGDCGEVNHEQARLLGDLD